MSEYYAKRYRIMIDFEVTMEYLTESMLEAEAEAGELASPADPLSPARIAAFRHQHALQQQMLKMPEVLNLWLQRESILNLQYEAFMRAELTLGSDRELLLPAIEELPSPSRHHFREALAADALYEALDWFKDLAKSEVIAVAVADAPQNNGASQPVFRDLPLWRGIADI